MKYLLISYLILLGCKEKEPCPPLVAALTEKIEPVAENKNKICYGQIKVHFSDDIPNCIEGYDFTNAEFLEPAVAFTFHIKGQDIRGFSRFRIIYPENPKCPCLIEPTYWEMVDTKGDRLDFTKVEYMTMLDEVYENKFYKP